MMMMGTLMRQLILMMMTMSQILTNSSLMMHLVAGLLVPSTDGLDFNSFRLAFRLFPVFFTMCCYLFVCRGVARYLKTLFDEESGRGRKNVVIDHLVNGKSRKEASRMFFETLVRHQFCFMVHFA